MAELTPAAKWVNRQCRLYRVMFLVCVAFIAGQLFILSFGNRFMKRYHRDVFQEQKLEKVDDRVRVHHERNARLDDKDHHKPGDNYIQYPEGKPLTDLPPSVVVNDDEPAVVVPPVPTKKKKKPRPTRPASGNAFISQYHKHWKANCSGILGGDRSAVKDTSLMLKMLRDEKDHLPMPSDIEVLMAYRRSLRRVPKGL